MSRWRRKQEGERGGVSRVRTQILSCHYRLPLFGHATSLSGIEH